MAFGALVTQTDVVGSGDPTTLEVLVRESFAAQLVAHPTSQLLDVYLAGGGAGAVLSSSLYYSTLEDGKYPDLLGQRVKVLFGYDVTSLRAAVAAFYASLGPADRTTFADSIGVGAGNVWVTIIIYQPEIGDDLLALEDTVEPGTHPATEAVGEATDEVQARFRADKRRALRANRRAKRKG